MQPIQAIPFHITSLETAAFFVTEEEAPDTEDIEIASGYSFQVDEESQTIEVEVELAYEVDDEPFVSLTVVMGFDLGEEGFAMLRKGNHLVVPHHFLTHATSLTLGAARGILHTRLASTPFSDIILPIIDLSMLAEDMVFEL